MDKITRILLLYRRFMHGDLINKYETSLEFGISERSFDRDIQDIRLFLSEAYSNLELEYDEKRHGYCIKNLNIRRDITIEEAQAKFKDIHQYGEFKKIVADKVLEEIVPFQERFKEFSNPKVINEVLNEGKERASRVANRTLNKVKKTVGLYVHE